VIKTRPIPEIETLRALTPFRGLPDSELAAIQGLMERTLVPAGEMLIDESQVGDCFYILMGGRLEVSKASSDANPEVLNIISEPGELFGEMSLVEDKPRSASVRSLVESDVLTIPREGFLKLVNHFPQFTLEVARNISNYLRKTDQTLISALREKTKRLEETVAELEQTRQELVEKERLSILGRMSATVIHDLKNPLTTISGFAQLLRMRELPKAEVEKYADNITRQVEQFMAMTQEVLAYARGGVTADLQDVEVKPFLQECLMGFSFNLVQKKMKLTSSLEFEGTARLDPNRFPRVLENLVNNAIDAMGPGGVLHVRATRDEDQLLLEIKDTGTGIPEDIRDRIFEEFFTFGKHGGTGLGLAITHNIVEEHGGTIRVDSTEGEGTCFGIRIPVS